MNPQRLRDRDSALPPLTRVRMVMGGDFPFRRLLFGKADAAAKLQRIVSAPIKYERKVWRIPPNKIRSRLPNFSARFPTLDLVVGKGDWHADAVVDLYTEGSRMATPGYGEDTSPLELYNSDAELSAKVVGASPGAASSPESLREALYTSFGEARLAYASLSRNLYAAFRDVFLGGAENVRVLDISAYGDRAIAAASLGFEYVGIDPDSSLTNSYAALRRDLSMVPGIPKHALEFNQMPLEAYVVPESAKVDLFTVSPPPYDMEPYGGAGTRDPQTHATYSSMQAWARGFLFEIAHRAKQTVRPGGVFAVTALDRTTGPRQIAYVEYLLLLIESMGFEYKGAVGLPSSVPWWTFVASSTSSARAASAAALLGRYYPEWYGAVIGAVPLAPPGSTPLIEIMRVNLQSFVVESLRGVIGYFSELSPQAWTQHLGRWLSSVPSGPLDPVFPSDAPTEAIQNAGAELVSGLVSKIGAGNRAVVEDAVFSHTYVLQSGDLLYAQTGVGIAGLYKACALFMRFIVNRTSFARAAPDVAVAEIGGKPAIIAKSPFAVRFLRHEVPFGGKREYSVSAVGAEPVVVLWKSATALPPKRFADGRAWSASERKQLGLVSVRYDTLGIVGHHFTRPMRRIQIMEQAAGSPVVDLFANVFNANSLSFGSLYPDVEAPLGAIGNFFAMDFANSAKSNTASGSVVMHRAFMANPTDTPAVLAAVAEKLDNALRSATEPIVFFVGLTVWHDTNPRLVSAFESNDVKAVGAALAKSDNPLVAYAVTRLRPFLVAAYRLDAARYPTVLPSGETRASRPNASSIGLVLANPPRIANVSALNALGSLVVFGEAPAEPPAPDSYSPAITYPYRRFFLPPPRVMFLRLRSLAESGDFALSERGSISRSYPEDYEACDGISNHFTEDVRAKARVGRESPAEVWASLRVAPIDYAKHPELARRDQALLYDECQRRKSPEANIFNAAVAVYFYAWLLQSLEFPVDLVDPSSGWGDRLIAALACGDSKIKSYTGYDPNEDLQPGYARIVAMLSGGSRMALSMETSPFEDAKIGEGVADLAMTSPPFYDLETYILPEHDAAKTQSTTRYKSWAEWLSGMYRPYLANIYKCLRRGGYAIMYVSDYRKSRMVYPLADETTSEFLRLGAALFQSGEVETGGRPRPFYVFKKPDAPSRPVASAEGDVIARELLESDAEAVHAIASEAENVAAAGRERSLESVQKMIEYFARSGGDEFFFALEVGGVVVGYVGFERITPMFKARSIALKSCAVRGIDRRDVMLQVYTASRLRGTGVFRRAWPALAARLKTAGVRAVIASTYSSNVRGKASFAGLGGAVIAECRTELERPVTVYKIKI